MKRPKLNPPQITVLSFFSVILLGTFLLNLPVSAKGGLNLNIIDSLFTATSATCVTGLSVKDTGSFFSPFGRIVLVCLMQVGGLGIMTFSTMFAIFLGRKLTISQNVTVQQALDSSKIQGLSKLILYIVIFTFSIEGIGAALLYLRWMPIGGPSLLAQAESAVFHSVSAFCNCGLSLFPANLEGFCYDKVVMGVFSALIVIGGLGFIVFLDIPKLKFWRSDRRLIFSRISLQTKIVIVVTLFLIVSGAAGVFLLEGNDALKGMSFNNKIACSLFTSITPRTAGFNVVPTGALRPATLFMIIMLMFIGASPGSTGGGIKTVTFGVMIAAFISMLCNRDRISIYHKTIPRETYRRSTVIVFLALAVVFVSTFILLITETSILGKGGYFLSILFEVVSALGTVGLSTGITPDLSVIGKLVIIATMFIGRVGSLTIALAMFMRKERTYYTYPEEKLMVG